MLAVVGLALLLGLAVAGPALARGGGEASAVEVRVWQHVDDERDLYVSARPAGGSWRALGTVPLALDGLTASESYRYGDIALALPEGDGEAEVEVRIWQNVDEGWRFFIAARPADGSWPGRFSLLPDDGLSSSGRYRYGDITLAVSLPDAMLMPTGPVVPSVTVAFEGEFPAAERAVIESRLREEFHSAASFFAEWYGLTAPGLTILMMRPAEESWGRMGYANKTIMLSENFEKIVSSDQHGNTLTIEVDKFEFVKAIAHEYVHALQDHLSGGRYGPSWIVEGMAQYLHYQHHDVIGRQTHKRSHQLALATARLEQSSLRNMETYFNAPRKYAVSFLATDHLVKRANEDALFDFYRNMRNMPSWQAAFLDSFGISVEDFYEEFAKYRAENGASPVVPRRRGPRSR